MSRSEYVSAEDYCIVSAGQLNGLVYIKEDNGQPALDVTVLGRPYSTWRESWEELASALGVLLDIEGVTPL